jgi:hypothetical protein
MRHNVLQYETVGFSERVPIHRCKKLEREPNPRKPLNPNCFIFISGSLFIHFSFSCSASPISSPSVPRI